MCSPDDSPVFLLSSFLSFTHTAGPPAFLQGGILLLDERAHACPLIWDYLLPNLLPANSSLNIQLKHHLRELSRYMQNHNKHKSKESKILIRKQEKDTNQKRKLQVNITDVHRCKNPQQNSSKQNPKTHQKDHTS